MPRLTCTGTSVDRYMPDLDFTAGLHAHIVLARAIPLPGFTK